MPDRPASAPWLNGVQSAVAANLATITLYLVFQVLPVLPDEVAKSVEFLITLGIASGVGFATGWVGSRLRNAEWETKLVEEGQGRITGLKRILVVLLAFGLSAPLVLACASYDRAGLAVSAARFGGEEPAEVTPEECEALARVASALTEGPDRASYLSGRAQTLSRLSESFLRHSAQCDRAVALAAEGQSTSRVRAAFRRSWVALGEIVQ